MDPKLIAAIGTAIATALAGSGYLGSSIGYKQRDAEVTAAFPRCKCKLNDMLDFAKASGWERPDDWCELAEERDE